MATRTTSAIQMFRTCYAATRRVITLAHSMAPSTNTTRSLTKSATTFTQVCTQLGSTQKSNSGHNRIALQTILLRRVSTCRTGRLMTRMHARISPTTLHRIKMHPLLLDLPGGKGQRLPGPSDASTTSQSLILLTLVCSVPSLPTSPKTQCLHSGEPPR